MGKNFAGQDLQGQSFAGQNLVGADFRGANVSGCDFSEANLRGARFDTPKTTPPTRAVGANFGKADLRGANFARAQLHGSDFAAAKAGTRRRTAVLKFLLVLALSLLANFLSSFLNGALLGSFLTPRNIEQYSLLPAILIIVFNLGFIALILRYGLTLQVFTTLIMVVIFGFVFIIIAVAVAGAGAGAGAVALLNLYIVWRVSRRDPRFELVRGWGVAVGAWGGTRFVGANLAGANFGRATLPHASFVGADIGRAHWFGAKKFELARFGPSHSALRNRQVEQLLLTGAGAGVNFDGLDLHGLHLGGADLQGASLIGCNLNEAVLAHANLSAAKLKQTQLDGADLGGANLTGATIEDWGITRSTHLQEVRCEYIYLRLPTRAGETPLRKPDDLNKTFEPGDFSAFIQPMVETLDLYFNKGVQPQAMAAAYKVVSEANPEAEMEIVAMENRGGGAVLVRVKTSPEADKSMLSQQFHAEYQGMQTQLASREQQLLLKDAQIEILQNTITGIAVPQRFYPDPQRELSPELLLLHGKLEAYFSLDDLRQIAFELRTDDESIGGATKPAYAREMLKYFDRRGRIAELVGVCRAARPDVAW